MKSFFNKLLKIFLINAIFLLTIFYGITICYYQKRIHHIRSYYSTQLEMKNMELEHNSMRIDLLEMQIQDQNAKIEYYEAISNREVIKRIKSEIKEKDQRIIELDNKIKSLKNNK